MISVIVPTYNCETYICEAIDSILDQTYTDYEIVVVDDGSTDATRSLLTTRYAMIRYFYVENNGVAAARNFGIAQAHGELIAFLDADDRWLPEKLEKQTALFQENAELGMVFTENFFCDERGITDKHVNKRVSLMRGDIVRNIFSHSYVVTSTVMVRKAVFDVLGLFEEGLAAAEDDNMWMRIGMKFKIELLDEPMLMYRITEGSLSNKSLNIFAGVKKHIELLKSNYRDIYHHVGMSAIRVKYSELYFSEAYYYFSLDRYRTARNFFLKSYMYNPYKFKSLLYAISTLLPYWTIKMIKYYKRINK